MDHEEERLRRRFLELADRAYTRGVYTYTEFLGLYELNLFYTVEKEIRHIPYQMSGGSPAAERRMIQFGCEKLCGAAEPFPIAGLHIAPRNLKFSEELSHRDYLGAVLNLGIRRETLGDFFIKENECYLVCTETISNFIIENLLRVRRTPVKAEHLDLADQKLAPSLLEKRVNVISERVDAVVSAAFALSRSAVSELIKALRVAINGRVEFNSGLVLQKGAIVSVRGYGRFQYGGIERETKKGRYFVKLLMYQ